MARSWPGRLRKNLKLVAELLGLMLDLGALFGFLLIHRLPGSAVAIAVAAAIAALMLRDYQKAPRVAWTLLVVAALLVVGSGAASIRGMAATRRAGASPSTASGPSTGPVQPPGSGTVQPTRVLSPRPPSSAPPSPRRSAAPATSSSPPVKPTLPGAAGPGVPGLPGNGSTTTARTQPTRAGRGPASTPAIPAAAEPAIHRFVLDLAAGRGYDLDSWNTASQTPATSTTNGWTVEDAMYATLKPTDTFQYLLEGRGDAGGITRVTNASDVHACDHLRYAAPGTAADVHTGAFYCVATSGDHHVLIQAGGFDNTQFHITAWVNCVQIANRCDAQT